MNRINTKISRFSVLNLMFRSAYSEYPERTEYKTKADKYYDNMLAFIRIKNAIRHYKRA